MYFVIGKAVLYQAIGLKSNQKIIKVNNQSECATCPWLQAAISSYATEKTFSTLQKKCSSCNCKAYEIIYENEKNMYGFKSKLNRNSILLLLKLHSLNPTSSGFLENINVENLAIELNVNIRTIRNNISTLVKSGYIYCENIYANHINLILLDYKDYFLTADKGGRGYVKLSSDTIKDLCNIKSILVLRLILRELLSDKEEDLKTYKELSNALPSYCKRNVISKKLLSFKQNIFNINLSDIHVHFSLVDKHNIKSRLSFEIKEYSAYYSTLFDNLNEFILAHKTYTAKEVPQNLYHFLIDKDGTLITNPVLTSKRTYSQITDLAKLACKYSEPIVTTALADTYRLNMCKGKKLIKNLGSYVLQVIRSYGIKEPDTQSNFILIDSNTSTTSSIIA